MADYYDIGNWVGKTDKFADFMANKGDHPHKQKRLPLHLKGVDPVWLYCLLKAKISPIKPNGFFTFLQNDSEPLGNLFWWDYIMESEIGFINVVRRPGFVECHYNLNDSDFDVIKFFKKNIGSYKDETLAILNSLETHTLIINHYVSYANCTEYLFKELKNIDISKPDIIAAREANKFEETVAGFLERSIKYHALGKSHILNCAFMVESFLNLFIRITMRPDIKAYPDLEKKYLNFTFLEKLKNINFFSVVLNEPLDTTNSVIQETLKLMKLRNKYVHFDSTSEINIIGEVKFDKMFPVFPEYLEGPIIQSIERSYHIPDKLEVKQANETATKFVKYIFSLVRKEYSESLHLLMHMNPIGYNQVKNIYSAIFPNTVVDSFPTFGNDDNTFEMNGVMMESTDNKIPHGNPEKDFPKETS